MHGLTLNTIYSGFQYSRSLLDYSNSDISSSPFSFTSTRQDDCFEGESILKSMQPEDLPSNIGEMYRNGDYNLKELIFLLFCPVKKTYPSVLTSSFSPESIEDETVEENHYSQLPHQEPSKIFAEGWPVISAFFNINLSQIITCEQYIKQEISEWKYQHRIAISLVKNKYAKNLVKANILIDSFLKKYPKYNNKINRNNIKKEPRYKNFYINLISKALRYGITQKEDVAGLILIKTNFKVSFKTACNKYYKYKKLASAATFTDKKDKIDLCIKREKYRALIQNHKNEIDQTKSNNKSFSKNREFSK